MDWDPRGERNPQNRGVSRYVRISWDEAAQIAADELRRIKETYGCDAVLIPNGINRVTPEAPDLIRSRFGLEKDGYILFLARITPEKGLDYLIEAYKQLKTDKKLVVAGSLSPETDYIRSVLEQAKGCENIIFADFVSGKLLAELFTNCYLYVLPSDIEGMPMSLLEAVGYDARVVVSDIPENVDCLEGYGNAFAHSDPAALRKVLEHCLQNEALKDCDFKADRTAEQVQRQRAELIAKYDWNEITDRTLELYKSVQS